AYNFENGSYEGFGTRTPSNDFTRLLLFVLGFTPGIVASLVPPWLLRTPLMFEK
ncbi:hypothetical protein Tco_0293559, partial [Tanacetum coccineum]